MDKNRLALLILGVGALGLLFFWASLERKGRNDAPPTPAMTGQDGTLMVATSFYPLADFARQVGGDGVAVANITPGGAEPHDYEPTPQDIIRAQDAHVFLYNGNGLDPWAEKIAPELARKGVRVIKMSDSIQSIPGGSHEHGHEGGEPDGEAGHEDDAHEAELVEEGTPLDPHFWLDPVNAQAMVRAIAQALKDADPAHSDTYTQNEQAYLGELASLHADFERGLATCQSREIVTAHNAFGYLARRYSLENHFISGLSPEDEPAPQRMAQIADEAREEGVRYIFFETLVSPELAETIAREIGAQTLVLNPLEGLTEAELASGKDYLSVMRENLSNLRTALACQ